MLTSCQRFVTHCEHCAKKEAPFGSVNEQISSFFHLSKDFLMPLFEQLHLYLSLWISFPEKRKHIYSKAIQFIPFLACKRIHQLFCFVDGFLMLICRVKYLFVPLSPFCHSVYPVLVTHFIYLCAWLHSCAHVFFIMLFHCHPVSTHSIQCRLLEGL